MLGASFRMVVQKVLHDGDSMLYKLCVGLINWHLNKWAQRHKYLWHLMHVTSNQLIKMSHGFIRHHDKLSHRTLGIKESADAVFEFVEQHGIERWTELQPHQVFDVSADLMALLMIAHHQRQKTVQKLAQGCLWVPFTRGHGYHGALAIVQVAHGRTVGGQSRRVPLLQTHATQRAQEACHIDPFLRDETRDLYILIYNDIFIYHYSIIVYIYTCT